MIIFGTNNNDKIDEADGVTDYSDHIFGHNGRDDIWGLGGADHIFGENGNDILTGGAGADFLDGGANVDTARYADSVERVTVNLLTGSGSGGDAEGDALVSIEKVSGSGHDDLLIGDGNNNGLIGMDGDDTLRGGAGADTLIGGDDVDTAAYDESNEAVHVALIYDLAAGGHADGDELIGIENLTGSSHDDHLWGDNNVNVLNGMNGNDELKGYGGADTLLGGEHDDKLMGLNDDDELHGESGNDTLDGGAGNDTMIGWTGDDTFIVDSAGDVVEEAKNGGKDTIEVSFTYTLSDSVNVETLRTSNDAGTAAIDLTGNIIVNTLVGNAGANILDGKGGADIMSGLSGNDTYHVNHANDFVNELAGQGGDTVRATVNYQLKAGKEVEALTTTNNNGVDAINLTGNGTTQVIVGNAGVNVLQGLGGDDNLQGMAGNDTLTGGSGNDKFLFNTPLNAATNVDSITDMTAGVDLIRLDDAVFAGIGPVGVLNADAFHIGAAAADAEDRIVYNKTTGQLFFDSNGNAAGGSTLFANLTPGLVLSNTDFNVV